ncbi:CGNR zinc finger domain-containing protein [Candidatus Neomarinimicrobiota bacterium]
MNQKYHGAHWGSSGYQNLKTGWLCLDFANTADWHASEAPEEQLVSYDELLAWALDKAILDQTAVEKLRTLARRSPAEAQQAHVEAIELREVLYRLFATIAAGQDPAAVDHDTLNGFLSQALIHLQLQASDQGYQWGWRDEPVLESIPWPIVWSASRLLTSKILNRVGQCADDRGCGWLFIDMSKNHSRRWCDMRDCGNRDKVRRYYARQRDAQA